MYVPVVTLLTQDNNKLWNKYRSEMTNQAKTNNLNYMIDPTFSNVNRLFFLSFQNEQDRTSFSEYYTLKVEMKYFDVLIDGKSLINIRKNY